MIFYRLNSTCEMTWNTICAEYFLSIIRHKDNIS